MDFFQLMEEREVVEGRTWQSLRARYLRIIRKAIQDKTDTYGLDPDKVEILSL